MQVSFNTVLNFKRSLKPSEEADYIETLGKAKQKVGNTGHSMLIIPSSSLPHALNNNTGCGNMLNKESREFFDFAKLYWGINYVQLLPEGIPAKRENGYRLYSGSSLDLGNQLINLKELTTERYGNLLSSEDIEKLIQDNIKTDKDLHINFENVLGKTSPTEKLLRKAFDELIKNDSDEKKQLIDKIDTYISINREWLERKSIFEALALKNGTRDYRYWDTIEKNLYNTDIVPIGQRQKLIWELESDPLYNKESSYYMFKQYLADRHLAESKKELNSKGIKLSGDMLVNCSFDETWLYPKAFYKDYSSMWGLNAINFETNEGKEFFRLKVRNFAKRYDGIRVDASWLYDKQYLQSKINKEVKCKEYKSEILDIIDEEFRNIKGRDYNLINIMHEFEADPQIYSIYQEFDLKPEVRDRVKIYKTNYLNSEWESVSAFKKRGWDSNSYILGATNHDTELIKNLYKEKNISSAQMEELAKLLKIPVEKLQTCSEFIQAKFAEPIRSMHNMFFFADALNLEENYCGKVTESNSYRLKIPSNYKEKYFKSLEKGEGLNIMDALEKAFIAEGLDKEEPELFEKIRKYNKILRQKESSKKGSYFAIAGGLLTLLTAALLLFKNNKKHDKA